MLGRPGRYISIESGPTALRVPRIKVSRKVEGETVRGMQIVLVVPLRWRVR
jgi:hypothetical protein